MDWSRWFVKIWNEEYAIIGWISLGLDADILKRYKISWGKKRCTCICLSGFWKRKTTNISDDEDVITVKLSKALLAQRLSRKRLPTNIFPPCIPRSQWLLVIRVSISRKLLQEESMSQQKSNAYCSSITIFSISYLTQDRFTDLDRLVEIIRFLLRGSVVRIRHC